MRIDSGIIVSGTGYFAEIHGVGMDELDEIIDFDETGEDFKVSIEEFNLVTQIIALQLSYFCLRRVSHSCESNTDTIYLMLQKKYIEYEKTFKRDFINLNEGKLS